NGFSSARRRKNSAFGNSWCENGERWSSRKNGPPDWCEKLCRRQTEHELSAELRAFWFAHNPGRTRTVRRRQWSSTRGHRLNGNHNQAHCGCNGRCSQIPRAEKFFSRGYLRLWRTRPCSLACAFFDVSAQKSLRLR